MEEEFNLAKSYVTPANQVNHSRLAKMNGWMGASKIKVDYKYSSTGPSHNISFIAEMGFYVKELKRNIHAREGGSNKQSASKSCALSLVRQLFHLGVIEVRTSTIK